MSLHSRGQLLQPHVAGCEAREQAERSKACGQLAHVGVEADVELHQECEVGQASRQGRQEVVAHIQVLQGTAEQGVRCIISFQKHRRMPTMRPIISSMHHGVNGQAWPFCTVTWSRSVQQWVSTTKATQGLVSTASEDLCVFDSP